MRKPVHQVGFTGHREGVAPKPVRKALDTVLAALAEGAVRIGGEVELHTGAASGADLLCIRSARALNLPVHILLPLAEDEFMEDFNDPSAWREAQTEIDRSRRIPGCGSVIPAGGGNRRPQCYASMAASLLGGIDTLVAVWDGKPTRGPGGTAQVVAQAGLMGRPVVLINPLSGAITRAATPPLSPNPVS